MSKMPKIAIVMGSKSDIDTVKPAIKIIKEFGVAVDVRVLSAHRTPNEAHEYVALAQKDTEVFIGVAGKAAHLAGVIAGYTYRPVIALPVATSVMGGLDSLLSMVQMPSGVPVATVAIGGGVNAGLLALQILGIKYDDIATKLLEYKEKMRMQILDDDKALQAELAL